MPPPPPAAFLSPPPKRLRDVDCVAVRPTDCGENAPTVQANRASRVTLIVITTCKMRRKTTEEGSDESDVEADSPSSSTCQKIISLMIRVEVRL